MSKFKLHDKVIYQSDKAYRGIIIDIREREYRSFISMTEYKILFDSFPKIAGTVTYAPAYGNEIWMLYSHISLDVEYYRDIKIGEIINE